MDVNSAAKQWGMMPHSVERAVRDGRLRSSASNSGEIIIPDDEIKPLRKSTIQALLWTILQSKNDPSHTPDISKVPDLHARQLASAFKQLEHRKYLDQLDGCNTIPSYFARCRITDLGMELVRKDPLPGGPLGRLVIQTGIDYAISRIFNALPNLLGSI